MANNVGFGTRFSVFADNDALCKACGMIYNIEPGKKTDLLFHGKNHKIFYVLFGKAILTTVMNGETRKTLMQAGQSLAVEPLTLHRLETEDSNAVVVEFGTDPLAYKATAPGEMNPVLDTRVVERGSPIEVEPTVEVAPEPVSVKKEPVEEKPKPKRKRRRRTTKAN